MVGVPDADRGENVAAAVVRHAGRDISADDLRERVKRELSAYKVPRHFVFFEGAALPFTDSGKIDRRRLQGLISADLGGDLTNLPARR